MGDALQLDALDLFAAWIDWPPTTRDALLEAELHERPSLRADVRRLIDSHARSALLPTEPPEPRSPVAAAPAPTRVGAYRLVELIGEGGMGLVFRGERDDGVFTQTVAIKLIRASLFSAGAAAQFADERQILARPAPPPYRAAASTAVSRPAATSFIVMGADRRGCRSSTIAARRASPGAAAWR